MGVLDGINDRRFGDAVYHVRVKRLVHSGFSIKARVDVRQRGILPTAKSAVHSRGDERSGLLASARRECARSDALTAPTNARLLGVTTLNASAMQPTGQRPAITIVPRWNWISGECEP